MWPRLQGSWEIRRRAAEMKWHGGLQPSRGSLELGSLLTPHFELPGSRSSIAVNLPPTSNRTDCSGLILPCLLQAQDPTWLLLSRTLPTQHKPGCRPLGLSRHRGLGKQQGPGSQHEPKAFPGFPLGRLLLLPALLPAFPSLPAHPACVPLLCSLPGLPSCSPCLCCCCLQLGDLLGSAVPAAHPAAAGHRPVCVAVVPVLDPQPPAEPAASCCLVIQTGSLASRGAHCHSVPGDPPGIPGLALQLHVLEHGMP